MNRLASAFGFFLVLFSHHSIAMGESLLELRARTIHEAPIFQKPPSHSSAPSPILILVDYYKNFGIVKYLELYYAIPPSKNIINPSELNAKYWPDLSLDSLRLKIDHFLNTGYNKTMFRDTIRFNNYKGFNIIKFRNKYYGIYEDEGRIDFHNELNLVYPWFIAFNIDKVNEAIDRAYLSKAFNLLTSVPQILIQEGYKEFNIVKSNNVFYGIDQRNGEINIDKINQVLFPVVRAKTIDEVKSKIDAVVALKLSSEEVPALPVQLKNKLSTWARGLVE